MSEMIMLWLIYLMLMEDNHPENIENLIIFYIALISIIILMILSTRYDTDLDEIEELNDDTMRILEVRDEKIEIEAMIDGKRKIITIRDPID